MSNVIGPTNAHTMIPINTTNPPTAARQCDAEPARKRGNNAMHGTKISNSQRPGNAVEKLQKIDAASVSQISPNSA